jgi:hypothetical protein
VNKGQERGVVEGFLMARNIPISAVTEWDRERPDFLATIDGTVVGIEVTYLSEAISRFPTHLMQWRQEAHRIVKLAQAEFEGAHPELLITHLGMRPDWKPGAVRASVLAKELADTVAAALVRPWPHVMPGQAILWNNAHASLSTLRVNRSSFGEGFWAATIVGSVVRPTTADICATVARKEIELPAYRTAAARQWLLIDCSMSGQQISFDVPDPIRITTGFDRVFCTGFGMWEWVEMLTVPLP